MKLTFPRVGIAFLLVFAVLIRDDLFPAHDEEHAATDATTQESVTPEAATPTAAERATVAVSAAPAPAETAPPEAVATASATAEPVAVAPVPALPVTAPAAEVTTPAAAEAEQWSVTEYWVAARTAFMLGDIRRAREEYANVLAAEPGNWFAHEELGNVYARNQQFDKAVHHYQRAALLLVEAARFDDARKLAMRMADLYPSWKDRVPEGLADH